METTPMKDYQFHLLATAARLNISADIVRKLIRVESADNEWAWNPEPRYRYLWDVSARRPFRALTAAEQDAEVPPRDFPSLLGDHDNEFWGQQASWGLMQVMGAVAREHGFTGPYLTELCDPLVNISFGCYHLDSLIRWADGDVERALAAYNGGRGGNERRPLRNQQYASKVLNTSIE